jgi:signal transduction histidine kinase
MGAKLERAAQLHDLLRWPDGRPIAPPGVSLVDALMTDRAQWSELILRNVATGETTPIAMSVAPIRDASERATVGSVLSFHDITPVKELERLRAEWSSIVAHDLRQPLHTIATYSSLLLRAAGNERDVERFVEQIRGNVTRLDRMIGDLMDLSRLEARRLELSLRREPLPAIVRAAVERIALDASDREVQVRVHGDPPPAEIDPDRIAQVMDNLLSNAIKYGDPGTPVVVDVEGKDGQVSVAVTNQGKGIAPADVGRLFHRFERPDLARGAGEGHPPKGVRRGGVGLGLYITRGLVEAHGGKISVESTPGAKTIFRFTLPAA